MNTDEYQHGLLPFEFQCKNYSKLVKYDMVLNSMPSKFPPVVLHKHTEKRGNRFYEIGTYAILKMDDFVELIEKIYGKKKTISK